MSTARPAAAGGTRTCPHCRATILESANACPVCRHRLRFDPGTLTAARPTFTPLQIEGTIHHPDVGEAWEYSVMLTVRNDRGDELARQMVGVGALSSSERRTFTLAVEVFKPGGDAGSQET